MDRRTLLGAAAASAGSVALGGSLWRNALASVTSAGWGANSPYGRLLEPDENGLALPSGFHSRVVARTGQAVGQTGYAWHPAPDGGACFADGAGWIYVSNSEVDDTGGVSAIKFAAGGRITAAYRILEGTDRNCAGGATPWGTWLSCEEVPYGRVYETDPRGEALPVMCPDMGRFKHEAAAVDPQRRVVYLTEDEPDGCFYRFRPTSWPDLTHGSLEVLCGDGNDEPATWALAPDLAADVAPTRYQVPEAMHFDGGEGAWYADNACWFTTKGDNRVWRYEANRARLVVVYGDASRSAPLNGVDNIMVSRSGEMFVAEDGPNMAIVIIAPDGEVAPFLRIAGHGDSEVAGPAFSPHGTRLYFSSQRGESGSVDDGLTYEVSGPFRPASPRPQPSGGS